MVQRYKTAGVYINDINTFPNSKDPVATAILAFIGHIPKAEYQGKSYFNTPQLIASFTAFAAIYLLDDPALSADLVEKYQPEYYLVAQAPHSSL